MSFSSFCNHEEIGDSNTFSEHLCVTLKINESNFHFKQSKKTLQQFKYKLKAELKRHSYK